MLDRLLRRRPRTDVDRLAATASPGRIDDPLGGLPFFATRDETVRRAFQAFTLHTAHRTILAAGRDSGEIRHEALPNAQHEIILFRSNWMPDLGLLAAPRPIALYGVGFESPIVPIIVVDHPETGRIALRNSHRIEHVCALEPVGETGGGVDFHRPWIGPWELFSAETHRSPILRPEVERALAALGRFMENGLSLAEIISWSGAQAGTDRELVLPALMHFISRKNTAAPDVAQQHAAGATAHLRARHLMPTAPPSGGPLHPLIEFLPAGTPGPQHLLRGTWDFLPDGRILARGSRVSFDFTLPYHPTHARLRLELKTFSKAILMTVAVNGWRLGFAALDHFRTHGVRLDFWIPREALSDLAASITLDFDPAATTEHDIPHAFELLSCTIEIGARVADTPFPADDGALMGSFESLGNDCEFGFVQRHFAIEPLGILRFAGFGTVRSLTTALENEMKGLGDTGSLTSRLHIAHIYRGALPEVRVPEFFMSDANLGFSFHTWKGPDDSSQEDAQKNNEIKLSYLRRKFLEDLEDADKIWIYKQTNYEDVNEINAIYDLLGRRGPNKLFWVTRATEQRPAGSVEWFGPRLLRGYSSQPHIDAQRFVPAAWLELCRNAFQAFAIRQPEVEQLPVDAAL